MGPQQLPHKQLLHKWFIGHPYNSTPVRTINIKRLPMHLRKIVAVSGAVLLCVSCADKSNGDPQTPATSDDSSSGGASDPEKPGEGSDRSEPAVELAESPSIDLLANRYRFHAGGAASMVIPMAAAGVRKYSQDYARPWGPVVKRGESRGRVLERRSTELRVPWRGAAPESIAVRAHGLGGGNQITLRVNGKSAGSRSLGDQWETVRFSGAAIREGENELAIHVRRAGKAGGKRSWALWHSAVIGAESAEPPATLEPVDKFSGRDALTGSGRFTLYTEIPETAHLVLETGTTGAADLTVRATPIGGEPVELLSASQGSGWQTRQISLAPLAGKLVVLDLETSKPAATGWAGRVALEVAPVARRPPPIDNAVLVVVDALRADKLKAYDPKTRVEAPRMNGEIAERGAVFLENQAASPSSPPSHGSIQTGMIPRVHGVAGDKSKLNPGTPMLSTQAREAGLAAGYYGNNAFGMGRLEAPGNWTAFHQPAREGKGFDCTQLIPEMLGFIRAQKKAGKRFVLSSLPYEPHTPYRYHEGISDKYHSGSWGPPVGKKVDGGLLSSISSGKSRLDEAQWSQLRALYDGEVTYFDRCYAQLLDGMAEIGVAGSTALILTSDHGEGMYEHGRMGHAFGHFSELGDVPLVLFVPKMTDGGKRIEVPTSHIDIVPTILDLLGVEIDPKVQGRSLVPLILRDGPWTPRVVSLEYGRSYSLRARDWRFIVEYDGAESLYNLAADPTEQREVSKSQPVALRYLRDIAGFFLEHRSQWSVPRWGDLANHSPAFAARAAEH
jgi:arylsulfatase A-like enzyme